MGGRVFKLARAEIGDAGVAGAALALMAWPRASHDAQREDWQSRITRALRLIAAVPSGEVAEDDPLAQEVDEMERLVEHDTRFRTAVARSLDLGHLAMPWLKFENNGDEALLPEMTERTKASLQKALVKVRGPEHINIDPSNFNRSQWNPSLPAVHLAAAMRIVMQVGERNRHDFGYLEVLQDWHLLEWWLEIAETIEPAAEKAFPEIADTIVRVRLA